MRVDHRRAHVFVTEKFLHCADVVTTLQQVSSEGVTQTVTVGPFYYSRCVDRFLESALQYSLGDVMSLSIAAARIERDP